MEIRYRGFGILVKDDHGFVRALVVDPSEPKRYRSFPASDARGAVEIARRYVDRHHEPSATDWTPQARRA
jgi:hypothetical protein